MSTRNHHSKTQKKNTEKNILPIEPEEATASDVPEALKVSPLLRASSIVSSRDFEVNAFEAPGTEV